MAKSPSKQSVQRSLFSAISADDVTLVAAAISAGADVNAPDPDEDSAPSADWYPLHWTALAPNRATIATLLLDAGAKPEPQARGFTPLILAAERADVAIIRVLLEAGAKANGKQANKGLGGGTALHAASEGGQLDILRYLVSVGGRLDALETSTKETLLHPAARNGHVALVKYLLAEGIDPNAKTRFGSTALAIAKECGNDEVVAVLDRAASRTSAEPSKRAPEQTTTHARAMRRELAKNMTAKPKTKRKPKPPPKKKAKKR